MTSHCALYVSPFSQIVFTWIFYATGPQILTRTKASEGNSSAVFLKPNGLANRSEGLPCLGEVTLQRPHRIRAVDIPRSKPVRNHVAVRATSGGKGRCLSAEFIPQRGDHTQSLPSSLQRFQPDDKVADATQRRSPLVTRIHPAAEPEHRAPRGEEDSASFHPRHLGLALEFLPVVEGHHAEEEGGDEAAASQGQQADADGADHADDERGADAGGTEESSADVPTIQRDDGEEI